MFPLPDEKKIRSRLYSCVLYPEDKTQAHAIEQLKGSAYSAVGILHDKDIHINEETGEPIIDPDTGKPQPKKPHYHFVIRFKNARYRSSLAKELQIQPNYLQKSSDFGSAAQMMRDVTNDAVSAQAVSDGIIPSSVLTAGHAASDSDGTSDDDSSSNRLAFAGPSRSGGGTAPQILTRFPDVTVLGFNLSGYSAIDLSWYSPYKSEVDTILSGFMYLGYVWLLFKRLPSIIRGGAMASFDYEQVQQEYYGKKGD